MADVEQLIEKFRAKLLLEQEAEKHRNEIVIPLVNKVFVENFTKIFQNLADEINNQLGFKVVTFQTEGKNRFVIEGQYHRIYFQKSKIDILENFINVNIVPIYIWKGVTKHLGPISLIIDSNTEEIKWDISSRSVEEYSKELFSKFVDDEDFFM